MSTEADPRSNERIRQKATLTAGALALATFVASVALVPTAPGYRPDLYGALSPLAWIAFAIGIACGVIVIYSSAVNGSDSWIAGLGIVLGLYAAFFWLPVARGYVLYATPLSDALYHLGVVKDVIQYGSVPEVIYPATHVLIGVLVMFTDLPRAAFQPIVSYLFTVLLILGISVSARQLFRDGDVGRFGLLVAVPLVYGTYHVVIMPWFYALCLFPLLLYLLDKRLTDQRGRSALVALGILLLAYPFYHPMISLLATGILVAYFGYSGTLQRLVDVPGATRSVVSRTTVSGLFLLPLIPVAVIAQWHFGLGAIRNKLLFVILALRGTRAGAASFAGQAGQTTYTLFELIWEFLVLRWGPTIVYLGVATVSLVAIGYRIRRERGYESELRVAALYLVGIGSILASLVLLRTRNPVRAAQFALLFAIYVIAVELWRRSRQDGGGGGSGTRPLARGLVAVVLIVALLSAGITYHGNAHLTETTVEGTVWHLEHQDRRLLTQSDRMSRTLEIYHYGERRATEYKPTFTRYNASYQLPKHLGYDSNESVAATGTGRRYLVTKYSDTRWYLDQPKHRYANLHYYNQSDLSKLSTDPAADRIYTSGNFTVWLATG